MRWLYAILISLGTLASSLYNSIVWMQFEVQQDYYATQLCVKKEIKDNDCQGHCQLKALLQADDEPDKPALPEYREELSLFLTDFESDQNPIEIHSLTLDYPLSNQALLSSGALKMIWRPPIV
ncbi:hypothetical protein [Croceimicrobium hydrocarbonivorans]|uniref:Uncharacterized protein n=1 Tax=Croceimicrobium hydrocarbonivorans TaxID=2761580 RepID=A0A7H0VC19_9FLAO|nr:hypothetical protein [Croceimicrobium hydrocarbonivorans]QNR23267.1 hypothetical protein H4K34_12895 [Croceimicrobium hydrocarbonivorans]